MVTTPSRPLPVVAAVIARDGAVLACRRAEHKDAAGRWEFPGGKVEAGETPQDALRRELREELGVEIRVGALLDRTVTGRVDLACYAATLLGAAPTGSTDHDALEWRATEDLAGLDWADADRPVVARLAGIGEAGLAAAVAGAASRTPGDPASAPAPGEASASGAGTTPPEEEAR